MPEVVAAYVGLGSNLGNPRARVEHGFEALAGLPQTALRGRSRLYRTPPWGIVDQPDFVNAAAWLETSLAPSGLLDALLEIEARAGRVRAIPNGPRTLDLDLLLYGDVELRGQDLVIPHPRLHERAFVLLPLTDLAPDLDIHGRGRVVDLVARVDTSGCTPLD